MNSKCNCLQKVKVSFVFQLIQLMKLNARLLLLQWAAMVISLWPITSPTDQLSPTLRWITAFQLTLFRLLVVNAWGILKMMLIAMASAWKLMVKFVFLVFFGLMWNVSSKLFKEIVSARLLLFKSNWMSILRPLRILLVAIFKSFWHFIRYIFSVIFVSLLQRFSLEYMKCWL